MSLSGNWGCPTLQIIRLASLLNFSEQNQKTKEYNKLLSTGTVQLRTINRYSVISFSLRSADSLTDYPGEVKYFYYPIS